MMREGERQVSETLDGIRRDHVARYQWAAKMLSPGSRVVDFACGIGYGTRVLADAGHFARGFDIDEEAIAYARAHYYRGATTEIRCEVANGNAPGELGEYDAAVCFETIEHLEDPRPLLKALRVSAPLLLASVPNEAVMPFIDDAHPGGYLYHFRHYTKHQFNALLQECGWCVTEWHGQAGPESEVEPNMNGRTLVAVAQRDELPDEETVTGKHVAILGLGPSLEQYLEITKRLGGRSKFCDEVWTINALGDVFACDLVFHMDDVRIQEIRAKAAPASNIAAMLQWLKTSRVPVVTSRKHPDYPALVEYPLQDVLNNLGHDYFNSTAAYAVAFAIHTGVAKLSCFGMDFTYPKAHDAEKGRGCVEYWLGQAAARGIKLSMPKTTTLMDACYSRADRLYGYDTQDVIFNIKPDGMVELSFKERASLPTAEDLEARYDHSVHPNATVAAATGKGCPMEKVHAGMTGDSLEVESGGVITVKPGGRINLESGGKLQSGGTDIPYAVGVGAGYKIARGQFTTVSAADTVVTGLATVAAIEVSFEDDVDGVTIAQVTAQVGNQAGAPAAGSVVIKTWKATSVTNPTLIAASVFGKKVNWIAIGS